ncbi:hypothetical protein [Lyngbya sp. CCAP 1446/10]|uniref:hypothetical protein n=1 Tax=Lyngbya sp. CCAP 1446/10 TaxID=439293 RepID=UPI002238EFF6|nr:hypothetical protein [Lyngbya sp. CCAP 1446/10]
MGDDVEGFDALMLSEDCGDLLDRIYLVFEDVGGRIWFDALDYAIALGYCGVKDDDFPWLVALDATNQGNFFFELGVS